MRRSSLDRDASETRNEILLNARRPEETFTTKKGTRQTRESFERFGNAGCCECHLIHNWEDLVKKTDSL